MSRTLADPSPGMRVSGYLEIFLSDLQIRFASRFDGRTAQSPPAGGRESLEFVPWALLPTRLALF